MLENICTSLEHFSMIIKNVLHHRELIFYSPTSAKLSCLPAKPLKRKLTEDKNFILPNITRYMQDKTKPYTEKANIQSAKANILVKKANIFYYSRQTVCILNRCLQ